MKTEQSAHTINNNNIIQAKRASADFYCLNRLLIVIMIGVSDISVAPSAMVVWPAHLAATRIIKIQSNVFINGHESAWSFVER